MKNLSRHTDLSVRVRNLITDEGDADRRNVETELADWIG
jgi:hypothetical protein